MGRLITTSILSSVLLLSACTAMIFQPHQRHYTTPSIVEAAYEDVIIESDPGLRLHGWKLPTPVEKRGTVLFLHGNGENISTHFANLYWLQRHGYDGYIFDYRGYGKSEGIAELDGVMRDVQAMIHYVVEHDDERPMFVIGHSLGGALAIHGVAMSAYKDEIDALITVEAFSDYREITREIMSLSWLTWLIKWPASLTIDNDYSPEEFVSEVSPVPLLVMHSRDDILIDFSHAMRLFERAREPKQFIEVSGGHNRVFESEDNRALILDYLHTVDE